MEHILMLKHATHHAKAVVNAALIFVLTGFGQVLANASDATSAVLPSYWIAIALTHDDKSMATPTLLVSEGSEAEVRVTSESQTEVNGATTEHAQTPAYRLLIVPSAAEQGLTQLRMKIYLGTPEILVAEPTLKVAGTGTVQFGDPTMGVYTLNLALQVSDGTSKTPPANLVAPAFTGK
jgi:hypothetical protein